MRERISRIRPMWFVLAMLVTVIFLVVFSVRLFQASPSGIKVYGNNVINASNVTQSFSGNIEVNEAAQSGMGDMLGFAANLLALIGEALGLRTAIIDKRHTNDKKEAE